MDIERYCLITNDVETTSILNHKLRDKTGQYLVDQGMPRLLELYERYGVKATFFFTGYIARLYPQLVKMAFKRGHEVGSHGLTHRSDLAIDVLSEEQQLEHLRVSKAILEDITGAEVISFRAPAARVNKRFPLVLAEAGYKIDSSVSSQRIDMFMSFGVLKKLNWLVAPRKPYYVRNDNIFRRGEGKIYEIPISAFGFPYIGTFMRLSPALNRFTRQLLYCETLITGRPFNFLTHPNEFIDEDFEGGKLNRRASNPLSYFLGDVLRHRLKIKNLGEDALPIFERELRFFQNKEFNFVTCKKYFELKQNSYAGK